MKFLKWIDANCEKVICAMLMIIMTMVITAQIILRVFGMPLSWTEELARYMFVWLIYMACSLAVKQRKHVKVEAVLLLFKERGRFVLSIVSDILFLFFILVVAKYGYSIVYKLLFISHQKSASLQLPMWIPYSAVFVGSVLMAIRLIQDMICILKERKAERLGIKVDKADSSDDVSTMI